MTIEEAKRILHPDTSREAIAEINEQNGFDREKGIEKVKEACLVACEVMDKTKWIPCSERLPEDSRSVITYTNEGGVAEGSYSPHSEEWTVFRWSVSNAKVIAWMPLPEPYRVN